MEKKCGAKAADNGASKKARLARKQPAVIKAEPQQDEGEDVKTVDADLDPDTLEGPLCFAPFDAAIFQCKNGHAACESCCSRIHGACSVCSESIGDIRCRPLENAIAAMVLSCAFTRNGCTRRLKYAEKRAHEALLCPHAPCACPIKTCAYSGLDLHDHVRQAHADAVSFVRSTQVTLHRTTPFRVLLHALDARVFLLLNGGGVPTGRTLSVVCVGHRPDGNQALEYKMEVSAGGPASALSLSASGPVPCIRRWAGHHPTDVFLFVPDAYWSSSGNVTVTVEVRRPC